MDRPANVRGSGKPGALTRQEIVTRTALVDNDHAKHGTPVVKLCAVHGIPRATYYAEKAEQRKKESPDTDTSGEQGHDKPRGDESPARSDADDTSAPTDGEKVS